MTNRKEPPTIKDELKWAVSFLTLNKIANPQLEGEVLMAKALNWERVKVLAHLFDPISETSRQLFRSLVKKRGTGYPLQYLTGKQEFMSLEFLVTPAVLIPRNDTQVVVETVLSLKEQVGDSPKIVDVGTGSGAIAIAIKKFWPGSQLSAVDISPEALQVAKSNAQKHQVEIDFYQGDLLTPFLNRQTFDLIVSNPPYIPTGDIKGLQVEVTREPFLALDGGPDGLDYYRRLAKMAPTCLKKGGWLVVEIGYDQGEKVKAIFEEEGFSEVKIAQDYAGLDRVVWGSYI